MSHEYELSILVRGVEPQDDERVYDEVAKHWNAAQCKRRVRIVSIKGIDRCSGLVTPESLRTFLEARLTEKIGYPVEVAVKGTDREGIEKGQRFSFFPPEFLRNG